MVLFWKSDIIPSSFSIGPPNSLSWKVLILYHFECISTLSLLFQQLKLLTFGKCDITFFYDIYLKRKDLSNVLFDTKIINSRR